MCLVSFRILFIRKLHDDENIGFCQKFPSRILIQLVVRRRYDCINHFLDYIEKITNKNDSDNKETDNNNSDVTYMKLDPEVEDDIITININTIRAFIGAACRLADPVRVIL